MQDKIERIVRAAALAPSGDNCQPWQFVWNGRELTILHQDARGRHTLNYLNHSSLIALGSVLESIQIAAAHEGLGFSCTLHPNLKESPGASVRFETVSGAKKEEDLFRALNLRATDRRMYEGGSLREPLFASLKEEARQHPGFGIYLQDQYSESLLDYIAQTGCYVFETAAAHRDLFQWFRFNDAEAKRLRDGMPWRTLGANIFEVQILKLCKSFAVQQKLNALMFLKLAKEQTRKSVLSSAGMGLLTISSKSPEDLVAAGRIWMRLWCRLNLNGYGFQPLSAATLPAYDLEAGAPHADPFYKNLFQSGRKILQQAFQFPDSETPLLLFRTGKKAPLPEKCRSLRLDLSQIYKTVRETAPSAS
jgi:nitroreductase